MCKAVHWCNLEDRHFLYGKPKSLCSLHYNHPKNASRRPWLYYKAEHMAMGKLECEHCKVDLVKKHPDIDMWTLSAAMDVDHINSKLKGTLEGEHPDNYQLLCKHCHIVKSREEGDCISKINRKI